MSRSVGLAHTIRQADGSSAGVWGTYVLKSAFQPIFAFRRGRLRPVAYEGLVRPFRDERPIRPDLFFAGIPEADRLHVETLARTLHLLNAGACLDPEAAIFVNFDPSHFGSRTPGAAESTLRDMRMALHETAIAPARIVCEVTEKETGAATALARLVRALRASGCRIAVDDYGAEESDMQRIDDLAPDIVKFDGEWVARMMDSRPGMAMLSTMVGRFRERGIATVFEGIEASWQIDLAERAGVSMVQGFVLARPELAPADFAVFRQADETDDIEACRNPGAETATKGTAAMKTSPWPASSRTFGQRAG